MMSVVEDLWKEQPETFGTLIDIRLDERWRESTQSQAEFVANGLIPDMDGEIRSYLSTQRVTLRNAKVDRVYRARGWVVDGRPALSISLYSKLIFDQDLFQFWGSSGGTTDIDGIWVDKKRQRSKAKWLASSGR